MSETPIRRRFRALSSITLALLASSLGSGCCSFSAWACGVDRSAWVSIDFSTPDLALATIQEALRRGDGGKEGLFRSLSEGFKQSMPGVSQNAEAFDIGYEELQKQQPSLFVLGSASVVDSQRENETTHRFVLDLDGEQFEMVFTRQAYQAYEFEKSNGEVADYGEFLRRSSTDRTVRGSLDTETLETRLDRLDPVAEEWLDPATLVRLGVGQEWKLAAFAPLQQQDD